MNKNGGTFKLGTADTLILAVGTLAVDYICTSKSEIVEVTPGGKRVYVTYEEFEKKIALYGIKKGAAHPGSSIGNFITQVQEITMVDPSYGPVHIYTSLALKDPSSNILLDSLKKKGIQYTITDFDAKDAKNPIGLLVENTSYTKILSYKDKNMPAVEIPEPETGTPGLIVIGASAGEGMHSKKNALDYAKKHSLPIAVLTTEFEIKELAKNKAFKAVFDEIMHTASFFAANIDEVRMIIQSESNTFKKFNDRIALIQELRNVYDNPNLDVLLSLGSEGSMALVGKTIVIQNVPKIPYEDIVSTAGAGDALAGAFIQGVRIKGMDVEGVKWTLPRANRAAQNVLKYADTKTGQFSAAQFLEEPPAEYKTEIITL